MTETLPASLPATAIYIDSTRQRKVISVDDLKASIARVGVINPVVVRYINDNHARLIAGERRLEACRQLGIEVPVRWWHELDEVETKLVELEENLKRQDLPWRDQVRAVGEIHALYRQRDSETWTIEKTAEALSWNRAWTGTVLHVYANLDTQRLVEATGISHAYGILSRIAERRAAAIVGEIASAGAALIAFTPQSEGKADEDKANDTRASNSIDSSGDNGSANSNIASGVSVNVVPAVAAAAPKPAVAPEPVLCVDFMTWAQTYTGPRFNFIHCDFPYGVNANDFLGEGYENTKDLFLTLLDCLCTNTPKLVSHSAHMIFWLGFELYETSKAKLRAAGWHVLNRPLIWSKSNSVGSAGGAPGMQPRHTYEAGLFCTLGHRPLVKQQGDHYTAPTVSSPLHPTQKPESMLKYFFTMCVDENTLMLDPTCGSGASLRAAEDLGAKTVLGLELNSEYAEAANAATQRARVLRIAGR